LSAPQAFYRDGDCCPQLVWHATWVELQLSRQVVPADEFKVGAGELLGLGGAVATAGNTQLVRQFAACELQLIMQFVTVEL